MMELLILLSLAHAARSTSLTECLTVAGITPITSSSSNYTAAIRPFNLRFQPHPDVIFYASTPQQISDGIVCAGNAGVTVSALSGRHSYSSFGLDGKLVIDLSTFKEMAIDEQGIAKIGAGVRLGDIQLMLNEQKRAIAVGTCPWVGISGHVSQGGAGSASRMWGLGLDQVVALDVVLANGTIIEHLDESVDTNIYWAMKGAAPDFGIITRFYMETHAAPQNVVHFVYHYETITPTNAAILFDLHQTFGLYSAPAELGLHFELRGQSLNVNGFFYGELNDFYATTSEYISKIPLGYTTLVEEMSWMQSLIEVSGAKSLSTIGLKQGTDSFFAKSIMTPSDVLLTIPVMTNFFTYLFTTPTPVNSFVQIDLYGGANSKINAISTDENSFGHRDKLFCMQLYASSPTYTNPFPHEGTEFLAGAYNKIIDGMGQNWIVDGIPLWGNYINYIDPSLSVAQWTKGYWSTQYDRLVSLRTIYDPQGMFTSPQSIGAVEGGGQILVVPLDTLTTPTTATTTEIVTVAPVSKATSSGPLPSSASLSLGYMRLLSVVTLSVLLALYF